MNKFQRSFLISLLVFILVFVFFTIKNNKEANKEISIKENNEKTTAVNSVTNSANQKTKKQSTKKVEQEEEIEPLIEDKYTFLLVGIDINKNKACEADSIFLINADFKSGDVTLLNLPSNLFVDVDGYGKDELGHVFNYGGMSILLNTVRYNLNVPVNHYVKVSYQFVRNIIDSLEGIEIDIEKDMYYQDPSDVPPLYINIKTGKQVLDGDSAVHYLRYIDEEGYIGRMNRQKEFLELLIDKFLKLSNIGKMPKIYEEFKKSMATNFSEIQIRDALTSLSKIKKVNVELLPNNIVEVDGEYINTVGVGAIELIDKYFDVEDSSIVSE